MKRCSKCGRTDEQTPFAPKAIYRCNQCLRRRYHERHPEYLPNYRQRYRRMTDKLKDFGKAEEATSK
jgi:hypothetical protein